MTRAVQILARLIAYLLSVSFGAWLGGEWDGNAAMNNIAIPIATGLVFLALAVWDFFIAHNKVVREAAKKFMDWRN